jgi:hypothetical protein
VEAAVRGVQSDATRRNGADFGSVAPLDGLDRPLVEGDNPGRWEGVEMSATKIVLGRSPGAGWRDRFSLAGWRALRTFLQGVAAAFGTGGVSTTVLNVGYWKSFGVGCAGALITAAASFLQNTASFLPVDPTQKSPPPPPPIDKG